MIQYREATKEDINTIAQIHAKSWQRHYRGILSDQYLDTEVLNDRLSVWQKRFGQLNPKQHIIIAETNRDTCGFACTYLDHDLEWGALLDNLHVLSEFQGKGIGKALIKQSAEWVTKQNPDSTFYLWVWEQNEAAKGFYQKLKAECHSPIPHEAPGGGIANVVRCVWRDLGLLINL